MESSERNIAIWRKLLHDPLFCLEVTSIFLGGLKPPNKLNEWTLLGSKCILVSFIAVLDMCIYIYILSVHRCPTMPVDLADAIKGPQALEETKLLMCFLSL